MATMPKVPRAGEAMTDAELEEWLAYEADQFTRSHESPEDWAERVLGLLKMVLGEA